MCKLHLNYKHNKYYSQRVEGAQTLKGVRGQLRYLVITQVSVKANAKGKKSTQNQRQIGIEPEKQAAKEKKKAREKRNIEVSTLHKRESVTQCGHFLLYLHPSQLLIWRKSPGWDHLDGVLLQSSGTKHTHRPLRRSINILLSQRYLCRILDWCLFPEGTLSDKAL